MCLKEGGDVVTDDDFLIFILSSLLKDLLRYFAIEDFSVLGVLLVDLVQGLVNLVLIQS